MTEPCRVLGWELLISSGGTAVPPESRIIFLNFGDLTGASLVSLKAQVCDLQISGVSVFD